MDRGKSAFRSLLPSFKKTGSVAGDGNDLDALYQAGCERAGTVMAGSSTPPIYFFRRNFMQFYGGLGFVLIMLIFPAL